MVLLSISTAFQHNLIEILLGVILTFNIGAYKLAWDKIQDNTNQIEKNTESLNMILNRIFGIEQDPTDEGHLVETEKKFGNIDDKLDEIVEGQKKMEKQRKKEHEKVTSSINSIIDQLSDEEKLDFEKKKLK